MKKTKYTRYADLMEKNVHGDDVDSNIVLENNLVLGIVRNSENIDNFFLISSNSLYCFFEYLKRMEFFNIDETNHPMLN